MPACGTWQHGLPVAQQPCVTASRAAVARSRLQLRAESGLVMPYAMARVGNHRCLLQAHDFRMAFRRLPVGARTMIFSSEGYDGTVFSDFYVRRSPWSGPGWFIFGRDKVKYGVNADGTGNYVMLCGFVREGK